MSLVDRASVAPDARVRASRRALAARFRALSAARLAVALVLGGTGQPVTSEPRVQKGERGPLAALHGAPARNAA